MKEINDFWVWLVMYGIATDEELQLVTDINGYKMETLNDVLYARTGYRSRWQYLGIDEDEEEEVSGIGKVDNEWGAGEMEVMVMNTQKLYFPYKAKVYALIAEGKSYEKQISEISNCLYRSIKKGDIQLNRGMGGNKVARDMAARAIVDHFSEDWVYDLSNS